MIIFTDKVRFFFVEKEEEWEVCSRECYQFWFCAEYGWCAEKSGICQTQIRQQVWWFSIAVWALRLCSLGGRTGLLGSLTNDKSTLLSLKKCCSVVSFNELKRCKFDTIFLCMNSIKIESITPFNAHLPLTSPKNHQLYLALGNRVRDFLMIHDMAIVSQLKLDTASIASHTLEHLF